MKNTFVGSILSNCYLLLSLQDRLEPWGSSIYHNNQQIHQMSGFRNTKPNNDKLSGANADQNIRSKIISISEYSVLIEIRFVSFVSFVWALWNKFFYVRFLCSPEDSFGCALFLTSLGHRLVDPHDFHPGVAAPHGGVHPPSSYYPVILLTSSLAH